MNMQVTSMLIFGIIIYLFIIVGFIGIIAIIYYTFSYKQNYKRQTIKQSKRASKVDMQRWRKWYRELPATYSPAIVSILCDFQGETFKDLPAMILYFTTKNIIELEDDGLKIQVNPYDPNLLMSHEQYFLSTLKDEVKKFDHKVFQDHLINDAKILGLIVDKNQAKYKGKEAINIFGDMGNKFANSDIKYVVLISFSVLFIINLLKNIFVMELFTLIASLFGAMFGTIMILVVYAIFIRPFVLIIIYKKTVKEVVKSKFDYKRTSRGDEDYKNWIAFRNFISDFSIISEREIEEIIIWEQYLAYAVALNVAERAIKTSELRLLKTNRFQISNYNWFLKNIDQSKKYF